MTAIVTRDGGQWMTALLSLTGGSSVQRLGSVVRQKGTCELRQQPP